MHHQHEHRHQQHRAPKLCRVAGARRHRGGGGGGKEEGSDDELDIEHAQLLAHEQAGELEQISEDGQTQVIIPKFYGATDGSTTSAKQHVFDGNDKEGSNLKVKFYYGIRICACSCFILFFILNVLAYLFFAGAFLSTLADQDRTESASLTPLSALQPGSLHAGNCETILTGFRPTGESASELNAKLGFKKVWFKSRPDQLGVLESMNITAFYMPSGEPGNPTIIVQHGNDVDNTDHTVQTAAYYLRKAGYNVLLPNLRNHGDSEATPQGSMSWVNEEVWDVLGAFDYVLHDPQGVIGRKATEVALMGFSMGGYMAKVAFGMEPQLLALLTDGAVQDIYTLLQFYAPVPPFAQLIWFWANKIAGDMQKYSPEAAMGKNAVLRKVGIIHSPDDEQVPFSQSTEYSNFLTKLEQNEWSHFDVTRTWYGNALDCTHDSSPHCKDILSGCKHRHCKLHLTHQGKYCKLVCEFFGGAFRRSTDKCEQICAEDMDAEAKAEEMRM